MFDGKNILFVYSGLDNNLKVQQSFVFIKSIIDDVKANCKSISILTTTDEMGLFILDENIKIHQNAVNLDTILQTIDDTKADILVAVCGDKQTDSIICKNYSKIKEKVEIFQENYYSNNKNAVYFQDIAKQSGFNLYKKRVSQKRELCKEFFATCINDNFGNQIIFDICDYCLINEKPLFLTPSVLLQGGHKSKVLQIVKRFGKSFSIANAPYTIHFNIYTDGKIYFDNIEFGFSYEMIFSLNAKRIDIQNIIINGIKSLPIHYQLSFNYFSWSYDYSVSYKLNFALKFEEINFIVSTNNIYKHTNDSLFYRLCLLNKINTEKIKAISQKHQCYDDNFYIQTNIHSNIEQCNLDEDSILVYCDNQTFNNIGDLTIFLALCNKLKQETHKKLCLVASSYAPLFKCCNIDAVFVINENLNSSVQFIIKHFNTQKIFVNSFCNIDGIIDISRKCNVDIYGLNKEDTVLYNDDVGLKDVFFEKAGLKCSDFYNDDDRVYEFFCIKDEHNNEYQESIMDYTFFKDVNSCGLLFPFVEMNFDIAEKLNDVLSRIISKLKTSGIVNIKLIYRDGDIFVNNIEVKMSLSVLLKLNVVNKNTYFDCLIKAILGKHIDMFARQKVATNTNKFEKKIIFNLLNNQTITISGKTQDDILSKFKQIIINNDK